MNPFRSNAGTVISSVEICLGIFASFTALGHLQVGGSLSIPLIIDNPLDKTINVTLQVDSPSGWTVNPVADTIVNAQTQYFVRVRADAPKSKLAGWQQFTVNAQADGKSLGTISLRVELANWALPQ
jgi:uncharacterized membrane protein